MRGPSPRMTTVACAIHLADSSEGHKNFPRTVLRASGDPGPPLVACPGSPLARGRRERVFYLAGIGADGSHGKRSRHFRVAPPDARPADHGAPGARRRAAPPLVRRDRTPAWIAARRPRGTSHRPLLAAPRRVRSASAGRRVVVAGTDPRAPRHRRASRPARVPRLAEGCGDGARSLRHPGARGARNRAPRYPRRAAGRLRRRELPARLWRRLFRPYAGRARAAPARHRRRLRGSTARHDPSAAARYRHGFHRHGSQAAAEPERRDLSDARAAWDGDGDGTVIGHARRLSAAGAAFVNGTAAHGEDFDDTFEGGPVHAGAVIVPAVLAACERHSPDGRMALIGVAVGTEVLCRLSLVVPKAVHKAGFHPTAILGAMGAAAGVGAALGLNAKQIVDALGIAGSMAGGIIEYLAEGAWTKRLHAGWAAQSGIRAALLARHGFVGPRTVFEGVHGLFHGFAHTTKGDYDALTGDFGTRWVTDTLAFKPYPCGTMAQPYIDCARRLAARGVKAEDIAEIVCEVAEGTVHRLWEPLADKQRPRNGYSAKFATPYLLATGFVHGGVGLGAFTEAAIEDARVLALAAKVKFVIDPQNPYPNNYTGHIRATLKDGSVIEERQPYLRGGAQEPLTRQDVTDKFALNAKHGGWTGRQSDATLKLLAGWYDGKIDLSSLRG